ncbi:MAG: DUF4012 domain-containing protein [Anaerolineae bacterium]|nr:DUF4012 domain-containing protein [Anaerolineae bacterium]
MKIINLNHNKPVVTQARGTPRLLNLLGHVLIYLGLVALGFLLILSVTKSYRIYSAAQTINAEIDHLQALTTTDISHVSEAEWLQIRTSLGRMAEQFEALHRETEPLYPLLMRLGWVPVYGGDLQAAPYLITTGTYTSHALVILVEAFGDLPRRTTEPDWLFEFVVHLDNTQPRLATALAFLYQSRANIEAIRVDTLSPALAGRVQMGQTLLPSLTSGLEFATVLPTLLGSETPQTYLILAPNADELRPSGGFVTAAGHITFDRGHIVDFRMQNSADIDHVTEDYPYTPDPLYDYMKAGYWVLRDATWSPDYPSTAELAIDLYALGQGVRADGVVSLDQYGLAQLLRAFKPLSVDGEQVTSANVIDLIRWHWSPESWNGYEGSWSAQRKSFIVALGEAMRQTIEQQPSAIRLPLFMESVQQALAEKRLLLYFNDPELQAYITKKNWSGSIKPGQGDYLMIADANVGFNKASALVQRGLTYDVTLAPDGSAKATAHVTYRHQGQVGTGPCQLNESFNPVYEDNMQGCYWNYMRLVTPAAAQLVSGPATIVEARYTLRRQATTGQIDVEPLLDKQSWGQLSLVTPDETVTLDFDYDLPAGTARKIDEARWKYRLYLQKQPGTSTTDTQVTVTLPTGARLTQSHPLAVHEQDSAITFSTDLKTDWPLEIYYTLAQKE